MKETQMNRLTWVEYQARVQDEQAPVFLPVGALEQHGPHLPLGTDAILSAAVAQGVAAETAGLVAPALAYGYKSQPKCGGGQHSPGTTSLDAMTLAHTVRDTVREFARHGVKKLVIVNGHYENQWFLIEGIDLAMRELVRLDRIPNDPPADFPPYDIYPTRTDWVPPSGVLSSAKAATKEKGTAMVQELTTLISAAVQKEFS